MAPAAARGWDMSPRWPTTGPARASWPAASAARRTTWPRSPAWRPCRRRGAAGLGAAVTAALARHALDNGVDLVFLSAGSDDIARVYAEGGLPAGRHRLHRRARRFPTASPPSCDRTSRVRDAGSSPLRVAARPSGDRRSDPGRARPARCRGWPRSPCGTPARSARRRAWCAAPPPSRPGRRRSHGGTGLPISVRIWRRRAQQRGAAFRLRRPAAPPRRAPPARWPCATGRRPGGARRGTGSGGPRRGRPARRAARPARAGCAPSRRPRGSRARRTAPAPCRAASRPVGVAAVEGHRAQVHQRGRRRLGVAQRARTGGRLARSRGSARSRSPASQAVNPRSRAAWASPQLVAVPGEQVGRRVEVGGGRAVVGALAGDRAQGQLDPRLAQPVAGDAARGAGGRRVAGRAGIVAQQHREHGGAGAGAGRAAGPARRGGGPARRRARPRPRGSSPRSGSTSPGRRPAAGRRTARRSRRASASQAIAARRLAASARRRASPASWAWPRRSASADSATRR